MKKTIFIPLQIFTALMLLGIPSIGFAQHDSGVRGGPPGAGAPISGLTVNELALFTEGIARATQLEAVCDSCGDTAPGSVTGENPNLATLTNSNGLGARFNGDQCTVCHSHPALGGSGGFLVPNPQDPPSRQRAPENPMFSLIPHRKGGQNTIPSFITQYGPIREARFIAKTDGSYGVDGGVHQLFTIVGRNDTNAPGCNASILPQPDFATAVRNDNVVFRIPLQLFGLGLIESILDSEIMSHFNATAAARAALNIQGAPNRSGNDGTITRFGWKAQNKSMTIFAGEAYNVEMGITNEVFPQSTDETPACNIVKNAPNDTVRIDTDDSRNQAFNNPRHILPDWLEFMLFMRFLDGPKPVAFSASAQRGQQLFGTASNPYGGSAIGCAVCHTPAMTTNSQLESDAMQSLPVNMYSDMLIHHMGPALADNVTQGAATGDMFRTTPLWGVGQRRFFIHDGRASDLMAAISAHSSQGTCNIIPAFPFFACYQDSEANAVVSKFNALSSTDKQAILDFLRSL